MEPIIFRFYKNNSLISKIIRKITFGKYSHVAIGINGVVYQALPFKGVFLQPVHKEISCDEVVVIEVDKEVLNAVEIRLKEELNCGYDYGSIFRFLFFLRYKKNSRWYCSELADYVFEIITGVKSEKLVSPSEFYEKIAAFKQGTICINNQGKIVPQNNDSTSGMDFNYDGIASWGNIIRR